MDSSHMLVGDKDFKCISLEDSLNKSDFSHAAHCCIYSPCSFPIFKDYVSKAHILMQMRFDGRLGFPGGIIEEANDILCGLNRELVEEINLDSKFFATDKDYLFSHEDIKHKRFLHFYAKLVSVENFESIEKGIFSAVEYSHETLGFFRVPVFTMKDGLRGLPAFLCNEFAGNARDQLLNFLLQSCIMSDEEIKVALKAYQSEQNKKIFR